MPRICVVGSANVDYTVALPHLPAAGETVTGGSLLVSLGGKGANQAVAARRLGADVTLIGCVGADDDGERLRRALAAEGIDTTGLVATAAAATGTALIFVDRHGANQIGVASGANHALTIDLVARHEAAIAGAAVVLCQLELPLEVVAWTLGCARRHGVRTILNPAPAVALADDVLRCTDVLTPNAGELRRLGAEGGDIATGAHHLRQRGVGAVIVTLGGDGAVAVDARGVTAQPAFAVDVVDTTGAGDAFTAAVGVGLASGAPLAEVLRLASATAALACTRRGAQPSFPTRAAVDELLRRDARG